MGNQASKHSSLEKRYKVIKENHSDLTLLQQLTTQDQFCLKCFTFNSVEGLEACVEKMNGKKRINHQHLLSIKQIHHESSTTFCSNLHKVFVVIQYPFRTLCEEIQDRKRNWEYFSETEIWSILYSCTMALNYLYSTNLSHGCLTSDKIYIENDGLIKISDPTLFNQNRNTIAYMTKSQNAYLSPQQLQNKGCDLQISDVFVLGMILLQAIHLQGMDNVYMSQQSLNYKSLNQKINSIQNNYSSDLKNIIQKMLTNAKERIRFEQIQNIINDNTFCDESSFNESRKSLRKPLESLNNIQNSRKEEIKPSKQPIIKKPPENSEKQIRQSFIYSEGEPAFKKFKPIEESKYPFDENNNYKTGYTFNNYSSGYVPPYEFISPATSSYQFMNPTNFQNVNSLHYDKPRISNTFNEEQHKFNNNFYPKFAPYDPSIIQPIQSLKYTSSFQPIPQNIYIQTSPVHRLAEVQIEKSGKDTIKQPNETIMQVTQMSQIESPNLLDRHQLTYVNQECQRGSHYEGYKLNNKKHGFGRLYYQDGGYYEGEWKNNKMNGFAKLYYQSGDIAYEGYWMDDKLHGKGKVFNDTPAELKGSFNYKDFTQLDDYWLFYDGEFVIDAKQGFGTIKLTNGEIFEGEFHKDVMEGKGKFYMLNGKIITGVWKENVLIEIN